jgi:hypothetical protein
MAGPQAQKGGLNVKQRFVVSGRGVIAISATLLCILGIYSPAAGQTPPASDKPGTPARGAERRRNVPTGPVPRTTDGKPDLSGVWGSDRPLVVDIGGALPKGESLPMQPWAAKLTRERLSKDDPEANCLPTGVPRLAPYPMKYIQMPNLFVILFEGNIHSYRQIFLNRKEHPKELNPTWYGDSIGNWDGDTLVVDTTGFNDRTWFDFAGHPHTEQLHTIERFRRTDFGHIEYKVTIDDPGAYTRPFTLTAHFPLQTGDLMEYICNEDNRDVGHLTGFNPPTLNDGRGRGNAPQ